MNAFHATPINALVTGVQHAKRYERLSGKDIRYTVIIHILQSKMSDRM